jgi:ABC-type multidrug transport system ATPase subunit
MRQQERKSGDSRVLVIEDLGRRFGSHRVVEHLSVTLGSGERAVLWGPNGSGKTTVLRCAAGTLLPTSGRVSVAGHAAGTIEARQLVGVSLSQERSFYLRLSGHANLVLYARLRRFPAREAERHVRALEEELELEEFAAERMDRCSTGMVQQLAFARALLVSPSLLLLDEPTRSLDSSAAGRLWAAIERRPRAAVLIATHNRDDAARCEKRLELPT